MQQLLSIAFIMHLPMQGLNFTDASLTSIYDEDGIEYVEISDSKKWRILNSAVKTLGRLHLCSKDSELLDIFEDEDNGPGELHSFWNWRVSVYKLTQLLNNSYSLSIF